MLLYPLNFPQIGSSSRGLIIFFTYFLQDSFKGHVVASAQEAHAVRLSLSMVLAALDGQCLNPNIQQK